jgi:high affinity sulfate transporter 1
MDDLVSRAVPAVGWMRSYRRPWLSGDLIAGATAAAVVVPQAMGYATVAGLPVEVGLYTCIFPMVIYALLGGSRRLSFSTTSTIVALTGLAITTAIGTDGRGDPIKVAATLTFLTGIGLIVFRVLRLGWLVEAVSEATVAGLKFGVGLTIMVDQLPKLLGITPADGGFFPDIRNAVDKLPDANGPTVVLSVVTLAGLLAIRHWAPRIPGPLIALVVGIALVAFTNVTDHGLQTIAKVPTGLPTPDVPRFDHVTTLLPFALAIALMSYVETVTAARIARRSDDPPLDNNQEFVAGGAATLVGSFFQTAPPAGGFSQTQVNTNAGANTQLSELVTVALAVAVALFLAPVLSDLPEATLGAIVTVSVLGLVAVKDLRRLGDIDRLELVIAAITAFAALALNLLAGVVAGVILTFYFVLRSLNHPVIVELRRPAGRRDLVAAREGDDPIPGLLVLRIEGGLYTLNIRNVQDEIYRRVAACETRPEVLVLDVGGTADTSVTVMDVMNETNHELASAGTTMWVAALPVRAEAKARRTPMWDVWAGDRRVFPTVAAAVEVFEAKRAAEASD